METGAVIAVILVAVFVLTECRSPPNRTPAPYRNDCNARFVECSHTLNDNQFLKDAVDDYRIGVQHIDNICEDFQSYSDCARPLLPVCPRGPTNEVVRAGDFVCSQEGKSLLRAAQGSRCYRDLSLINRVLSYAVQCSETVDSNASGRLDHCQMMRETITCSVSRATTECGAAVGRLVDKLGNSLVPTQNECDSFSSSDVFKRNFELLTKRR